MRSSAFGRFATIEAYTKRSPAAAGGKVSDATVKLDSVMITPLMPVTKEIVDRYRLESPRKSWVTYSQGEPDIIDGDELYIHSNVDVEYLIRGVGKYPTDHNFLEIICDEVIGD